MVVFIAKQKNDNFQPKDREREKDEDSVGFIYAWLLFHNILYFKRGKVAGRVMRGSQALKSERQEDCAQCLGPISLPSHIVDLGKSPNPLSFSFHIEFPFPLVS